MTWKDAALVVLAGAVLLLFLRPRPEPPPDPGAPLRTAELIARLSAEGWAVTRAEAVGELTRALLEVRDSAATLEVRAAQLAGQVQLLGGEVRATADLLAEARTQLELLAAVDTTPRGRTASSSWDDGTFFGTVLYREEPPEPARFVFPELGARIEATLALAEGPDGSLLFSAAAADPRVHLTLDRPRYQPPEPEYRCTWSTRLRWGVGGTTLGSFLSLILGSR